MGMIMNRLTISLIKSKWLLLLFNFFPPNTTLPFMMPVLMLSVKFLFSNGVSSELSEDRAFRLLSPRRCVLSKQVLGCGVLNQSLCPQSWSEPIPSFYASSVRVMSSWTRIQVLNIVFCKRSFQREVAFKGAPGVPSGTSVGTWLHYCGKRLSRSLK